MSLGNLAPAFTKNDGQMSMKEVARRMTAYLHRKGLARETWTCASRRELRAKLTEGGGRRDHRTTGPRDYGTEGRSESPRSEVRSPKSEGLLIETRTIGIVRSLGAESPERPKCKSARPCCLRRADPWSRL
jgi:hypothetical protein